MDPNRLSPNERNRYARHLILPNFGMEAQLRLKNAHVLVVGAGGLGCPVLQYLAAAGVGHIGIVDFDQVDESNLQRQILYTTEDIGKSKALTAKAHLEKLNPHLKITAFETRIDKSNVMEIIEQFDVIADGTDNFSTRYLINDACVLADKVNVFASIFRFEGQVAVFNFPKTCPELASGGGKVRGVNYRDIHPEPPKDGLIPNCAEGGVLGVLPGIIGAMQANEVIKVITGVGEPLVDKLFVFDAESFTSYTLKLSKNPKVNITALPDEIDNCEVPTTINSISVKELKKLIDSKSDFQLIDVREPDEFVIQNIGGELIPLSSLSENVDKISKTQKVIIHCQSGIRSQKAIELLQSQGFTNLMNLENGILDW